MLSQADRIPSLQYMLNHYKRKMMGVRNLLALNLIWLIWQVLKGKAKLGQLVIDLYRPQR